MRKRIRVIQKDVGGNWAMRMMPNTLEAIQAYVGGHFETVRLTTELTLVCNEEGIPLELPFNCKLFNFNVYGNLMIVKTFRDEFTTMAMDEAQGIIRIFEGRK